MYLLLLEVMGDTSGHARHAAVQLGKCEGLVTLLRGTPHNVNARRVYLPSALLQQQGVSQEGLLRRGPLEEGVRDVVEILAERAQRHLEAARLRSRYPVYIVHCTMYNVQCTMYNVQCTMHNVQCTLS